MVSPFQMWSTLYFSAITAVVYGISNLSILDVFLVFWCMWPALMLLCAFYNWVVK